MLKRMFVALSIATVALAGVTAQESATFTLRSGERFSGQLVDMGGSGFAVRVNGQDRNIPTGEMALIDFAGSSMNQSDWDRVSGQHVLWLRNGQTLTGELLDVGGTSPLGSRSAPMAASARSSRVRSAESLSAARPTSSPAAAVAAVGGASLFRHVSPGHPQGSPFDEARRSRSRPRGRFASAAIPMTWHPPAACACSASIRGPRCRGRWRRADRPDRKQRTLRNRHPRDLPRASGRSALPGHQRFQLLRQRRRVQGPDQPSRNQAVTLVEPRQR